MAREATLTIRCAGFPPLYLRKCTQDLYPLLSGDVRRTVNGQLVYAHSPHHHKYRSVIHTEDKASFSVDMLWRGNQVEVECIQRIREKIRGSPCELTRRPLPASLSVKTLSGETVAVRSTNERTLTLARSIEEGVVSYRPLLMMRILNFHVQAKDEGTTPHLQLWLEEV